jgi:acylphosphatase
MVALRLVITGRVQGVGFRAWACREALRRGVRGWVRNRRDGSVEALLIAAPEAIEAVAEACRRGPALAEVVNIDRHPAEDDGSLGFSERQTV